MNKSLFMQFVLAVITLATTQATDHQALADAQKQATDAVTALQAEKDKEAADTAANALTDDENAKVQQALDLISAATPAAPDAVASTATAVAAAAQ